MIPYKSLRKKVEFEALGQIHIAFCNMDINDETIHENLKQIAETAFVSCISTDLVDDKTFQENDLDKIKIWNEKVQDHDSEYVDSSEKKAQQLV